MTGTYEDNLMVESHSPIAAADEGKGFVWSLHFGEKPLVLDDRCGICVPTANPSVAGS
jgi:hypothetical protein